jgi:poly [ADP-ribose] polymerase
MTNMLGIMSQGLRIAPPEAPTTGYMFGKGVYFADTFNKSAHYTSGYQTCLMLMCEVALGEILDLYKQ